MLKFPQFILINEVVSLLGRGVSCYFYPILIIYGFTQLLFRVNVFDFDEPDSYSIKVSLSFFYTSYTLM